MNDKQQGRPIALIKVYESRLIAALGLPEGTRLLDVQVHHMIGAVGLVIEHPSFQPVPDGYLPLQYELDEFIEQGESHEPTQ